MNSVPPQENLKKYINIDTCPVRNVISRFSGKWAMLILCILSENGSTRFNVIGKAIPDISPKVLTETLKSLIPVIDNVIDWAIKNFSAVTSRNRK